MEPLTGWAVGKTIVEAAKEVLDRVIPDPVERAKAERELRALEQKGEFKAAHIRLSAIIAEAQSADPWTSRARPSFLYVIYLMILAAIPVGIAQVINPEAAGVFTAGVAAWLTAIPSELWTLFGIGYLGYAGARTFDKWSGRTK